MYPTFLRNGSGKKMSTCSRKWRKTGKGRKEGEGGVEIMYCKAGGANVNNE